MEKSQKLNHAVALYRREQEARHTAKMLEQMEIEFVKTLNDTEFEEYVKITGDWDHERKPSITTK